MQSVGKNVDLSGALVGVVTRTPTSTGAGGIAFSSGYVLDSAGRRKRAGREDGSYWEYDYNARSELVGARKRLLGGALAPGMQFEYQYDEIGNREESKSGGDASGHGLRTTTYSPDALNQYTSVTNPGAFDVHVRSSGTVALTTVPADNGINPVSVGNLVHGEVNLDNSGAGANEGGRWVSVTASGSGGTQTGDRWLAPAVEAPDYDDDGNLVEDGRWSYTWDGENRLVGMEATSAAVAGGHPDLRISFQYDWRGRRIGKVVKTDGPGGLELSSVTRWLYDGWNPVAEFSSTTESGGLLTRTSDYVWGLDLSGSLQGAGGVGGLLAVVRHSGQSEAGYFPAFDGNGNVIGWTDEAGQVIRRIDYDPYGNVLVEDSAPGRENLRLGFGFSTKLTEPESGLCYYGYRYYDPVTGRWPSRDPIGERGGANLYGFVLNNALSLIDVLGGWVAEAENLARDDFPGSFEGMQEAQRKCESLDNEDEYKEFYKKCSSKTEVWSPAGRWSPAIMNYPLGFGFVQNDHRSDVWIKFAEKGFEGLVSFSNNFEVDVSVPVGKGMDVGGKVKIQKNTKMIAKGVLALYVPCRKQVRYYKCCKGGGTKSPQVQSEDEMYNLTQSDPDNYFMRVNTRLDVGAMKTVWESLSVAAQGQEVVINGGGVNLGPIAVEWD